MFVYLSLGASLMFMAAVWPPYNVYIAEALAHNDRRTVLFIMLSTFLGLAVTSSLVAGGASLAHLPLGKIGGAIVTIIGIHMLYKYRSAKIADAADEPKQTKEFSPTEAVLATFLVSATPGIYVVLAAEGLAKGDFAQIATVVVSSQLGVLTGGVLLAYGVRFVKIPMDLIGGILIILIGCKMFFS